MSSNDSALQLTHLITAAVPASSHPLCNVAGPTFNELVVNPVVFVIQMFLESTNVDDFREE